MNNSKKVSFFQSVFWKRFGVGFILLILAVVLFVASVITQSRNQNSALADEAVMPSDEQLTSIIDNREQTIQYVSEVAGVSVSRKESDDRMATSLFKYATTWDSADSYQRSYDALRMNFSYLDPNCQLLREFFPPLDTLIIKDASGTIMQNPFDSKINLSFISLETMLIDVQDDTYSYFGQLRVQSKGPVGGTADGVFVVTYQTDAEGHIVDPRIYMAGV